MGRIEGLLAGLSPFWAVQTQNALIAAITTPQSTAQAACARSTARKSASANTGAITKANAKPHFLKLCQVF